MKLEVNSTNFNVKGYVIEGAEKRFDRLSKYFAEDTVIKVVFKGESNKVKKVEISAKLKTGMLRSEGSDMDVRIALDKAIDKFENQLVRHKGKLKNRGNESIRYDNIPTGGEAEVSRIVKNKRFELKPMNPDEACFQLELLEHTFFVFKNEQNDKVCVVYKRDDGDYGMIEAE